MSVMCACARTQAQPHSAEDASAGPWAVIPRNASSSGRKEWSAGHAALREPAWLGSVQAAQRCSDQGSVLRSTAATSLLGSQAGCRRLRLHGRRRAARSPAALGAGAAAEGPGTKGLAELDIPMGVEAALLRAPGTKGLALTPLRTAQSPGQLSVAPTARLPPVRLLPGSAANPNGDLCSDACPATRARTCFTLWRGERHEWPGACRQLLGAGA